jgi:hypothetical protein
MRPRRLLAAPLALALLSGPAAAEDLPLDAALAQKAPAIVTVKAVLKRGEQEATREVQGVVVDPGGTVMVSTTMLGARSPARLHVLYGNDPTEHPAVLVANDSNLRLSFLQVLEAKDLPAVDLSKAAVPKVGQDLYGVTRSGRAFDFTPEALRLYVTGRLEKPRPLWDFAGDFMERGLPVFDASGATVGVIVDQRSASGVGSEGGDSEIFILPAEAAAKVLELVRERIPEAVEKAKKAAEEGEGGEEEEKEKEGEGGGETPEKPDEPKPPETPSPDEPKGDAEASR